MSFYFAYDGYGEDAYCVRTWGDGGIYDHIIDYDKVGKVTCVTNSLGRTTTYKMNPVGCVVKVIDPLGGATAYEYDERTLWKVKETDAMGGETEWEHDARGNTTKVTDPDGAAVAIELRRAQPAGARGRRAGRRVELGLRRPRAADRAHGFDGAARAVSLARGCRRRDARSAPASSGSRA